MKNNFLTWLVLSAIVMLLLPWLAINFLKGDIGMVIFFLLFFYINPIYSIIVGIFAGKNIKELWLLSIISAILFLIGTWIFIDNGEIGFIMYSIIYLAIGVISMFISMVFNKKNQK